METSLFRTSPRRWVSYLLPDRLGKTANYEAYRPSHHEAYMHANVCTRRLLLEHGYAKPFVPNASTRTCLAPVSSRQKG